MMPNIYETLIGAPPSGPEETADIARQLRGRQQLGELGILTGDNVLSPLGQSMIKGVQEKTKGLQQTRQKKIETDRLLAQQEDLTDYRGITSAERERHNRAMEKLNKARIEATALKTLNRIGKYPSQKAEEKIAKQIEDASAMSTIHQTFKPEYSSGGIYGATGMDTVENFLGRHGMGGQGAEDQALWWGEYKRVRELVQRHELFGSALTTGEQKSWKEANIAPGDSPDIIRKKLDIMQMLSQKVLIKTYELNKGRYDPDWEAVMFSGMGNQQPAANVSPTNQNVPAPTNTSSQGFTYTVNE